MQRGMEKGEKAKPSVHQDRAHSLHSPPSAQHRGRTLIFGLVFFSGLQLRKENKLPSKGTTAKVGVNIALS